MYSKQARSTQLVGCTISCTLEYPPKILELSGNLVDKYYILLSHQHRSSNLYRGNRSNLLALKLSNIVLANILFYTLVS